jgi:hypothetical protein
MTKRVILSELLNNQLINVSQSKKLSYKDITRLAKNMSSSAFDKNVCCLWNGYITNSNRTDKTQFVNFFFKDKKVMLHRLLYVNYIGELADNEYLKFLCENRGICCNINHMIKYINETTVQQSSLKSNQNNHVNKTNEINNVETTDSKCLSSGMDQTSIKRTVNVVDKMMDVRSQYTYKYKKKQNKRDIVDNNKNTIDKIKKDISEFTLSFD